MAELIKNITATEQQWNDNNIIISKLFFLLH